MPSIEAAKAAIPLPSAEINLGGTSTNEVFFKTASAQNGVAAGTALTLYAPGQNTLKNRPFRVRVGGRVTAGTLGSFTANLYWGTTSLSATNIKIATHTCGLGTSTSSTWRLDADLSWDSTSSQLTGAFSGYMAGTVKALTTLTTSTTSVDLSGESTSNGFQISASFTAGNAANVAFVDYFELLTQ